MQGKMPLISEDLRRAVALPGPTLLTEARDRLILLGELNLQDVEETSDGLCRGCAVPEVVKADPG